MSRRKLAAAGLILVAVAITVLTIQVARGERHDLGRGVHFRTMRIAQKATDPASKIAFTQVVEEWVSFTPFRWRAEVLDMSGYPLSSSTVPAPPAITRRMVFVFDGKTLTLLDEREQQACPIASAMSALARNAEHPLLFPDDFALSTVGVHDQRGPRDRHINLAGEGYSTTVLERDVVSPAGLFAPPTGYQHGKEIRTLQELIDKSGLSQTVTRVSPGVYQPLPPRPQLREAAKKPATATEAHYLLGMDLLTGSNYAEAEKELKLASKLAPRDTAPLNGLGVLYQMWGKDSEAITALEAVVKLDPSDKLAWKALSDLYQSAGKPEEAQRAAQRAKGSP